MLTDAVSYTSTMFPAFIRPKKTTTLYGKKKTSCQMPWSVFTVFTCTCTPVLRDHSAKRPPSVLRKLTHVPNPNINKTS